MYIIIMKKKKKGKSSMGINYHQSIQKWASEILYQ